MTDIEAIEYHRLLRAAEDAVRRRMASQQLGEAFDTDLNSNGENEKMLRRRHNNAATALAAIAALLLGMTEVARGQPIPVPRPKTGQCPSGTSQSGSYCTLTPSTSQCIPKQGQCPSGWRQSGGSCCP